jgi:hypothetical protein
MLKILAILSIGLICAGIVSGQADKNPHPNQQPTKQEQPALHVANGEQAQPKPGSDEGKGGNNSPAGNTTLERPQVWWRDSNWWLVIIAGFTGLVIGWQSFQTKNAAKAALLNAQAVINAERAWVVMIIEQDEEFPRSFRVKAKNCGSTPAMIVAASQQWCVIENATEMPEEPQYGHGKRFAEGVFLFPGESQAMMEFGRDHLRMPPIGYEPTREDDFQRVKEGQGSCIVFGNVVYRDILSSSCDLEHETRWCSLFKLGDAGDELILTRGRDGYTKHT